MRRSRKQARAVEPAPTQTGDLNATRADIRLAWSLGKSGEGFAAALEDKGYILASVTADEARASERMAAFAKEVGNYAPRFREGEIVVINAQGGVYRLDPKTTGVDRAAIEKYTATIDRDALMSMTDAKAVQQEARRTTARPRPHQCATGDGNGDEDFAVAGTGAAWRLAA